MFITAVFVVAQLFGCVLPIRTQFQHSMLLQLFFSFRPVCRFDYICFAKVARFNRSRPPELDSEGDKLWTRSGLVVLCYASGPVWNYHSRPRDGRVSL